MHKARGLSARGTTWGPSRPSRAGTRHTGRAVRVTFRQTPRSLGGRLCCLCGGGSCVAVLTLAGAGASAARAARSTDVAAVVVPILFLILLSLAVGFAVLYTKHRRLRSSFTAFANSHYSSRLGSAIFSSGDDLGKWGGCPGSSSPRGPPPSRWPE